MYGVAIRLGLVTAAAVLAGCAARRDDDSQPVNNDPTFTPDPPDTDTPPVDSGETGDTGDPITSQAYSDVQSTYDNDLDGYLTEANATQLQQAINDGYVTVDETGEAALSLIEQGKYDCNDSPLTGFYTFPSAPQRLTMNQINDCEATDMEFELAGDAMSIDERRLYAQGDITGDGRPDTLVGGNGALYIFAEPQEVFGPGKTFDPSKATYTISADGSSVTYPQVKDLTGDGQADLVFNNETLISGGALYMIPGPITASRTFSPADFSSSAAVATRGESVIKIDGAYFLTGDMDGYEPEVGEVVMNNAAFGAYVFPAIFEPGIHEWSTFGAAHPIYTFTGPAYTTAGATMPVAGDVTGDGFVDLLMGDSNYNYATLIHGGTSLYNYRGQNFEIDEKDNPYLPHYSSGTIHLADTTIAHNFFVGHEDADAYGAGHSLDMGDVDGDELVDLSIGVIAEDANGYDDAGCGYVIFSEGYNNGTFASGETIVLNGDVFSIGGISTCGIGENMLVPTGTTISSDLNGDGHSDSVLGTSSYDIAFSQSALTLLDNAGSSISLDSAEHSVFGDEGVGFGYKVSGNIDFDNDGYEEVIVNAVSADTDYILFGGPSE